MNTVFLLLGGNIGDIPNTFAKTLKIIEVKIGKIINSSSLYYSEPWGLESENYFYNRVIKVKTDLSPENLLSEILKIEKQMGRKRKKGIIESRNIDIDILLYEDLIINKKNLILPHPRMHLRKFCLTPLAEIAPEQTHPVFNESIKQLLTNCIDDKEVFIAKSFNNQGY